MSGQHVTLDWDERGGVTVHMDGSPQSHVQPDDPTLLVFEYVQHDLRGAWSSRLHPPRKSEAGAPDVSDSEWPRRQRADDEGQVLDVFEDEERRVVRLHVRLG